MGPASVVAFACWICKEQFKTNRDLKNHLVARPHERMRVVCPWCPSKDGRRDKTLRRMSDLKVHALENHKSTDLSKFPGDFFSEANGFYFSLYPKDYVRIVSASPYRSESATLARGEVLKWLETSRKSEKERHTWTKDWSVARSESMKRPFTPEQDFKPDYEDDDGSSSSKRSREYSPTRPAMTEWLLKNITFQGKGITVDIQGERNDIYRIVLKEGVQRDPKIVASLLRRTEHAKEDLLFKVPTTWDDIKGDTKLKNDLASAAGIDVVSIDKIMIGQLMPVYTPSTITEKEGNDTIQHDEHDQDSDRTENKAIVEQVEEEDEDQASEKRKESHAQAITTPGEGCKDVTNLNVEVTTEETEPITEALIINEPSANYIMTTPSRTPDSYIPIPTIQTGEFATSSAPVITYQPSPPLEVISSENSCGLSTAYSSSFQNSHFQTTSPCHQRSSTTLSSPSYIPPAIPAFKQSHDPRSQALNLLSKGCMPLFPPAKRNWDSRRVTIPCGTMNIVWPPESWQQMSTDQRLLQWEFAAMQLHTSFGKSAVTDRMDLLASFNFLALPGTAIPSLPPNPMAKMRFYNYDVLRRIAMSALYSPTDETLIQQYEEASRKRDTSTDPIIEILEKENIRLRL